MKKWLSALALTSALVVGLAACGSNNGSKDEKKIVVGASNTPHAEILEQAKPILEKQGIDLEIKNSKITSYRTQLLQTMKLMQTISSTFLI